MMKVTSQRNGLLFTKEHAASGGIVLAWNGTADGSDPWCALFFFSTFSRSHHNESVLMKKRITFQQEHASSDGIAAAWNVTVEGSGPRLAIFFFSTFSRSLNNDPDHNNSNFSMNY
jgi:hypothetical protein